MLDALRDAVIITVIVIFLFLGNIRTMLLCAVSIPFTYLITFAVMWLFGFEFHMVTLTGVILAVGMLLDDAIVVIENIERHYREGKKDLVEMVAGGTEEVMLAIFSGTYATVVVLVPIIFIGGYVQTVLRPLSLSLCIALVASYVVSVTIIPILAPFLLKRSHQPNRLEVLVSKGSDRFVHGIRDFFLGSLDTALRHRFSFIAGAFLLLVVTNEVRETAGGAGRAAPHGHRDHQDQLRGGRQFIARPVGRDPDPNGGGDPEAGRGGVHQFRPRFGAVGRLLRQREESATGDHDRQPGGSLSPQGVHLAGGGAIPAGVPDDPGAEVRRCLRLRRHRHVQHPRRRGRDGDRPRPARFSTGSARR